MKTETTSDLLKVIEDALSFPDDLELFQEARNSLATLRQRLEPPEGYVLVQVEPTEEMAHAWNSKDTWLDISFGYENYKAMIAARPKIGEK